MATVIAPDLTPVQFQALGWLQPGDWQRPPMAVAHGLHSLAKHRPDLCEMLLRQTERGLVLQYRLTDAGEQLKRLLTEFTAT